MRPLLLTLIILFSSALFLRAQDTLTMRSGEVIIAKIIEVNETDVKYKKFTYQDGPTFVVSKDKIARIRYADGSEETFAPSKEAEEKSNLDAYGYPRNLLSIDPLALAFGNAAVSYEHFTRKGKWSWRIPLSIAIFEGPQNRTGTGFDLKYYPKGQGKVRYYLGPSVSGFAAYKGYAYGGLMFINGVSFQPTHAFNITIDGGFGVGHVPYSREKLIFINGFIWRGGISLGLRL